MGGCIELRPSEWETQTVGGSDSGRREWEAQVVGDQESRGPVSGRLQQVESKGVGDLETGRPR